MLNKKLLGILQSTLDQLQEKVADEEYNPPKVQENTTGHINFGSIRTASPSGAKFDALNYTVMSMKANLDLQTEIIDEVLQNYTITITELEIERNEHQRNMNQLTKYVSHLNNTLMQTRDGEMNQLTIDVSHLNNTLMQIRDDEMNQNHSLNAIEEEMNEFFQDILAALETNQKLTNATLAQIQTDLLDCNGMITNFMRIETTIGNLTSRAEFEDIIHRLESELNKTQTSIEENNISIRMLEYNTTTFKMFTDDHFQWNDNIDSKLTLIQDIVKDYNATGERIKVKCILVL